MDCPLVMIEWEDSAQPSSSWCFLSDLELEQQAIRCVSVGWLIQDGTEVKALAPNMGNVECSNNSLQVSGVIRIPARCIIKTTELVEPELTSSSLSAA